MSAEENLQRMKTLDDAWNGQNWEVFRMRHAADARVHWPGQPDPPRGRKFCTVAHWKNGEIVEENLFYDQVGFLRQIGVL